jgi:hypothetical protein
VDADGKGIQGAEIRVMLRASNWGSSLGRSRDVRTDAEGRFQVHTIPSENRYNLTAMADGYGQCEINVEEGQTMGEQADVGRFTLAVADLSVSGVVVDSDGEPVPNADVRCYGRSDTGQPDRRTRADAEGKFTLDGVCAGRININANARPAGMGAYISGRIETEGGAEGVQIVLAQRSTGTRYVPKQPKSLRGKTLPDLGTLGVELPAEADGKMLLLCFWDMNQRPSRYCVTQLARRASSLGQKGVAVVVVQAAEAEAGAQEQWAKKYKVPFPLGQITGDIEETRFAWGIASLPHLVLTDKDRKVIAEGFGIREVDEKIAEVSGQ